MKSNEFRVLDAYSPIFYSDKSYFLISGGRGSGKSTQVAAYFLIKLFGDEFFRGVVSRYAAKSVKYSIYQDILDLAKSWNVYDRLKIVGEEIINPENDNMIMTHSFKIPEGTMSAKGKGMAKVTHLIIDEAQELPSEEEYIKVIDTFRTKGVERKIFITFNPSSKLHWLHKRFYIDGQPNPKWFHDHEFLHTTYKDNEDNIDAKKIEEWERMKDLDIEYYEHHILGLWRDAYIGKIYKNWNFTYEPDPEAEVIFGLDFGFSNDPTACIEVRRHKNRLWLKEVLYETGLTNEDVYSVLSRRDIDERSTVIADSAEPKSIEELRRLGMRRIRPASKGPGSVISGIKKVSSFEIYVDPKSKNLIDEYNSYIWKVNQDVPEDKNNHLLDALRYALSIDKGSGEYATFNRSRYERKKQFEEESEMYS